MERLSAVALRRLPANVEAPQRRPGAVGILHLGLGAFHRAHQVAYTDDALAAAGMPGAPWGIAAVSLKTPDARDRLRPQDGLFTVVEQSPEAIRRRVVGSLLAAHFLADDRATVRSCAAAPGTAIVSLTITEKGYGLDPATGRLDLQHADIARDLAHPAAPPASALGLIVEALAARRATHGKPFTVLCCDNLPHNGARVRSVTLEFAQARDPALARWIDEQVAFPSTMVDRIVPATTPDDVADNDRALGVHDAAPVMCEPFRQWVIEDHFVAGRPAWEAVGAQLVDDVAPFEAMKLRLLNGSHSALAYLGFLAGHDFVYQASADPPFTRYLAALMQEASATLSLPDGVNVAEYCDTLLRRFRNPALPHRTRQIAMDGSQKLPQRLLAPIREHLAAGRPFPCAALAVAAWMRYVAGRDEAGGTFEVADPLAPRFASIAREHGAEPERYARALMGIGAIFGNDLPRDERFVAPVVAWTRQLFEHGAIATLGTCNRDDRP